jgi:DnaJ-class molecular chaperone
MATTKRDYYQVLGVGRTAAADENQESLSAVALKNHPDKNPGGRPRPSSGFKEAAEAYEILSDSEKRQRYDRYGHAGLNGAGVHDFRNAEDIMSAFSEIFGGGLFGDMFGPRRRGPRPGQDLLVRLEIELQEASRGTTKPLELKRNEVCDECHGSGAAQGDGGHDVRLLPRPGTGRLVARVLPGGDDLPGLRRRGGPRHRPVPVLPGGGQGPQDRPPEGRHPRPGSRRGWSSSTAIRESRGTPAPRVAT